MSNCLEISQTSYCKIKSGVSQFTLERLIILAEFFVINPFDLLLDEMRQI